MTLRAPEFITFTGADDWTDVEEMIALANRYPLEWGILMSPKRQGLDARYPGGEAMSRFAWSGLRLSAHLCGGYSRDVMAASPIKPPMDIGICQRVQVNHTAPNTSRILKEIHHGWGPRAIAQTRGEFPRDTSIDWLYDRSGGRGVLPELWPAHPGRLAGYAGGINPENVSDVIRAIDAYGPYWIDMENGVRTDDRFDLAKCRRVCEAVYG